LRNAALFTLIPELLPVGLKGPQRTSNGREEERKMEGGRRVPLLGLVLHLVFVAQLILASFCQELPVPLLRLV
jgi:hypothetical protein